MYFNKKGILLILCQKYVTESCTFLESLLLILIAKLRHVLAYLHAIYFRFSFYNLTNNTVSLYYIFTLIYLCLWVHSMRKIRYLILYITFIYEFITPNLRSERVLYFLFPPNLIANINKSFLTPS